MAEYHYALNIYRAVKPGQWARRDADKCLALLNALEHALGGKHGMGSGMHAKTVCSLVCSARLNAIASTRHADVPALSNT